ncbi:hypothetical protein CCS79_14780 [Clostridium diolis]|uniref:Ig-like domain-containing protein n=1 Tax=Clostridium diolis TaxID=223919 RepID=UPI000B3FC9A2|nr:Ig-like domain-containing protein [Clostridium diolis]OVE67380.1 hypothetical protein CCS79_14780 [Clostridium diolis]
MKRKFINKIISGVMVTTTLFTLNPSKASAEWANDYQGNLYYMQDNQKMTGWKRIDGQLYYFDEDGRMQTGWIKAADSWYFLQSNGALKTGWINYNKNWYYADSNGVIQTGIINVSGNIYILDSNGIMKTSNTVVDGEFYTIGPDGIVVGNKVPTPDKEFDGAGQCIQVLKDTDNNVISPTDSKFNEVIVDKTESNDDPNEGRSFKVQFKDSNGEEIKTKTIKYGKSVDLDEPTKEGYKFYEWNTKSNGSGKSYSEDDTIKVKDDIILYAQWKDDNSIYVDGITVKGNSNVVINKTTQMTAEISPSDATDASVTWSVINGTGKATIDSNGVLTGVSNGTVTVKATAKDGSKVSGTKEVTVGTIEVAVPVSQITVGTTTGLSQITTNSGTLQMTTKVLPSDASNQDVTWSVEDKTGSAKISDSGLLTAVSNGIVTVKATAKDGSGIVGSTTITITGQSASIPVSNISIIGKDNADTITADGGTLQMSATVLPTTASNKSVVWSVEQAGDTGTAMTGKATINSTGLLTAVADGTVTVKAKSRDGSGITGTKVITISNQSIKVTKITVSGENGAKTIEINGGTLQMNADILPANASNKSVAWSVENKTGSATIDSTGVLTAVSNGEVNVIATAKDGSGIVGSETITLSNQNTIIPVSSIAVSGEDGASSITTDNGTLKMIATVVPSDATSQKVTWSVSSGTGTATIDSDGTLHAVTNGTVTVKATSVDYPKIIGTKIINLSGQFVEATGLEVNSDGNVSQLVVDGSLQMSANILPDNATYKTVKWSVDSIPGSSGTATINSSGILVGKSLGDVNVIATATDGTGIVGSKKITIIAPVKITGIIVSSPAGSNDKITSNAGTLQMNAIIANANEATNKNITWSVEQAGDVGTDMTGKATISSSGLLTAVEDGTVRVKATANDGSGIVGTDVITISGQVVQATGYTVKAFYGNGAIETNQITTDKGILQMKATVTPSNATTTPLAVMWYVEQAGDTGTTMTGKATIDADGTLHAMANGTVKVKVNGVTSDGNSISGSEIITISGQIVNVTGITVTSSSSKIASGNALQMNASISPTTATNKTVTWSVTNFNSTEPIHAGIDNTGKLTAVSAGTVIVTATANDGSAQYGTAYITIT